MIEIARRECRFGGSKTTLIITHTLYIVISLGYAEITRRECRLGGYKLSDWYTRWLYND